MLRMLTEVRELAAIEAEAWPERTAAITGPTNMAEIFPNEALAHLLEIVPRSNTSSFAVPTALYMGLWGGLSASTVPSADTALTGGTSSPWTSGTSPAVEMTSTGGYARATIGANAAALQAAFPTPVVNGSGMRTTMASPGTAFAESTGAYSATINGFFIANAASSTAQNTGKAFNYSNFSDVTGITVNAAGFTVRVAAYWHYDG